MRYARRPLRASPCVGAADGRWLPWPMHFLEEGDPGTWTGEGALIIGSAHNMSKCFEKRRR